MARKRHVALLGHAQLAGRERKGRRPGASRFPMRHIRFLDAYPESQYAHIRFPDARIQPSDTLFAYLISNLSRALAALLPANYPK